MSTDAPAAFIPSSLIAQITLPEFVSPALTSAVRGFRFAFDFTTLLLFIGTLSAQICL